MINLTVEVHENNIEQALRVFKKKAATIGLFKEFKRNAYYEKPSVKRKRKQAEALKKRRKIAKKWVEYDDTKNRDATNRSGPGRVPAGPRRSAGTGARPTGPAWIDQAIAGSAHLAPAEAGR